MKKYIRIVLMICFIQHAILLPSQNAPVSAINTVHTYETVISVPVTAIQFNNVASCNLQFFYNDSVMLATAVNLGPQMPGMISYNINTPGVITIGWFFWQGVSRPDNSTIFEFSFTKVAGGISAITWNNDYPDRNWFSGDFVMMNDIPPEDYYHNGSAGFLSFNAPVTSAAEANACPAGLIEVPVTVRNFHNIGSVFLTMLYDPLVVSFNTFTNISGFPNLIVQITEPGTIQVSGIIPPPPEVTSGFFLNDHDTLFTLVFNYLSGSSALGWLNNGASCQYKNWPDYHVLNQNPTSDYYLNGSVALSPLTVSCPEPVFLASCSLPDEIASAFSAWIDGFGFSGGCNPTATDLVNYTAPDHCGGSLTIEYTVTDEAGQLQSCISLFVIEAAPAVILNCVANRVIAGQNQEVIDEFFEAWLAGTTYSGGCNATLTNNNTGAPSSGGGTTIVTWNLISLCEEALQCTAVFTVIPAFSIIPSHSVLSSSLNPPVSFDINPTLSATYCLEHESFYERSKHYSLQKETSLHLPIHPQGSEHQKTNINYIVTPNPAKPDKIFNFNIIPSHYGQTIIIEYYQPEVGESAIAVIAIDGKQLHQADLPARPQGTYNYKMQINTNGIILIRMIFSSAQYTETLTKKIYTNH